MTDIAETIETETRTEVEREVVEHETEYEVCECQWCEGETPVDDVVPVALAPEMTTEPVKVASAESGSGHLNVITDLDDAGYEREATDSFRHSRYGIYVDMPTVEVDATVPFCAYCANAVFDIEVDDVLEAPAMQVYGPTGPDETTDDGRSTQVGPSLFVNGLAAAVGAIAALFTSPWFWWAMMFVGVPVDTVAGGVWALAWVGVTSLLSLWCAGN